MPSPAGISGQRVIAAFSRAGYRVVRQRGSLVILDRAGSPILLIPVHRTAAPYFLRAQIPRAGLTVEESVALL